MNRSNLRGLHRGRGLALAVATGAAALGAAGIQGDAAEDGIPAYAYQRAIGAPGAAIRVAWSRPEAVQSSLVMGYVVWRQSFTSPEQVVGGLFGDSSRDYLDTESARSVSAFDGYPGSNAGMLATRSGVAGIVPGEVYRYSIGTAYRNGLRDRNLDGVPDADADYMSPLSRASVWVTAIAPPTITQVNGFAAAGGGVQVDLRSVTVTWAQSPGADTYELMASSDARFRRNVVRLKLGSAIPSTTGGPATLTSTVNLRKGGLKRSRTVFVTVGARKRGEPKPRPFGAIFSAPVMLQAEETPPAPP